MEKSHRGQEPANTVHPAFLSSPQFLSKAVAVGLFKTENSVWETWGLTCWRRALRLGAGWLPDEHALVVVALPQAAIALVGDGEDVGGQLAQVAPAVAIHGIPRVQARDGLVGVHGGDDGADVGLQGRGRGNRNSGYRWHSRRRRGHLGTGSHSHPPWGEDRSSSRRLHTKRGRDATSHWGHCLSLNRIH